MVDETEFIRNELKRRGFPVESYVQGLLADSGWQVQPNIYFLDKETNKGRELDMEARYDGFIPSTWTKMMIELLIQCKTLPGNAWVFFSPPRKSVRFDIVHKSDLTEFLRHHDKWNALEFVILDCEIFGSKETHIEKREAVATNYCEVIVDKTKSNKRTDNIWESAVTLVKAVSQELDKYESDARQYLEEDMNSFGEFAKKPFDVAHVFFPIIVFEGKMYAATFLNDDIKLERANYVQLRVDYESSHYKRNCIIDVVARDRFSSFIEDLINDLSVFDKRRVEVSKRYESAVLQAVKEHFERMGRT
jgi:hypothetical protein